MRTTIRSWAALAVGLFCAAVTARTVLDDLWLGLWAGTAIVTVAHLQIIAALVVALASGHYILPMIKGARVVATLGLVVLFLASTALVITKAAMRNAEVAQTKVAAVEASNDAREAAKKKVEEARQAEADANKAARAAADASAKECKSGKGSKCDGTIVTRDFTAKEAEKAHAYTILVEAQLKVATPEVDPHGGYKAAALLAEVFGFGVAEDLEPKFELAMPFLQTLIAELATLVFLGMALGHAPAPVRVPVADSPARQGRRSGGGEGDDGSQNPKRQPVSATPGGSAGSSTKRASQPHGSRGRPQTHQGLDDAIARYEALHGRRPTISELVRLVPGVSQSTAARALRRSAA